MADIATPTQLKLADFIGKLITETFDAVVSSQVEQEKRLAEITLGANLTAEEFAASGQISAEETEQEMQLYFPPKNEDKPQLSAIYTDAAYTPPVRDAEGRLVKEDSPPVEAVLGVVLSAKPKAVVNGKLTPRGVEAVRDAIRLQIARPRVAMLRAMVNRGVPRVLVDSGVITAKFSYAAGDETGKVKPLVPVAHAGPAVPVAAPKPKGKMAVAATAAPVAADVIQLGSSGAHADLREVMDRFREDPRSDLLGTGSQNPFSGYPVRPPIGAVGPRKGNPLEDFRIIIRPTDPRNPDEAVGVSGQIEIKFKTVL